MTGFEIGKSASRRPALRFAFDESRISHFESRIYAFP